MTVCKFYRQGHCKFGNNCKYEHPPNLAPGPPQQQNNFQRAPQDQNRFVQFARGNQNVPQNQRGAPPQDNRDPRNVKDAPYGVTPKILKEDLQQERPLWIMSAYGPGKDADVQLFGGPELEHSPEEIRTLHYQNLARGVPQQSAQAEAELAAKSNAEVQKVLDNIRAALDYLRSGPQQHPTRNEICKQNSAQQGPNENSPFLRSIARQRQQDAGRPQGFGQPVSTGFHAQQQQNPGFGQQPNNNPNAGFGGPSTGFGGGAPVNGFGQSAQPQLQPSSFAQGPIGGFGNQPHGGFGAVQAMQDNSQFGQANAGFGQQDSNLGFGQLQQQPAAFGGLQQASSSVPTFDAQINQGPGPQQSFGGFFQQPQAPQVQTMTNGFQQPQQLPQPSGAFGGGGQSAIYGDVQSYTTRDASNKLLTWKGRPVNYVNGDHPCYQRDDGGWERIWFPDGPPPSATAANTGAAGAIEFTNNIKEAYGALREHGQFTGGIVPEVAPSADLVRWDI